MGNSLLEQLKKTGLVDEKKARKAKQGQYQAKKRKGGKKGAPPPPSEAALLAQKAREEKAERDRRLNEQRKREAERKAIAAQIRQLIETNRVGEGDGDIAYNFTDGTLLKRIHVSPAVHKSLVAGRLAIARFDGGYELVPTPVADKIRQRDEHCIIDIPRGDDAETDEDDPYADYKIPDDLMW